MLEPIATMDRMLKVLAASAAGVVCLAGCTTSIGPSTSSPSGVPASNSPAASVRARMVTLMGEHTYVVAKLAIAAAAGRKDEYTSYAGLLATNSDDIANVFGRAVGQGQGAKFGKTWLLGDSFFVDYMVAVTTRQQGLANAALENINRKYVPQMAQDMSSPLNISTNTANRLVTDQAAATKQLIDDIASGTPAAFYPDARAAYAKAAAMGGAVAEAIAWKFPDKYPGDVSGSGAKMRAQLDSLLQEHAYLLSMATDAAATGATAATGAAVIALHASTQDLSHLIAEIFGASAGAQAGPLWNDEDTSFVAYAKAADDASKATALHALNQTSTPALMTFLNGLHVTADVASVTQQTIGVIDDQRAKSYGVVAAEDRQSAALLVSVGDLMMGAGAA